MSGRPYAEVIGDPIAHSKSPLIHNFWLGKLGIDAEYRACHVKPDDLEDYFTRRRGDAEWLGCNVTIPHKIAVLTLVDAVEAEAREAGAANCVIRAGDGLLARSTDGMGVDAAIRRAVNAACVIGGGGAARAAIASLEVLATMEVRLIVRDAAKGTALLKEFGYEPRVGSFDDAQAMMRGVDCVINASPLGMTGAGEMPASVLAALACTAKDSFVFDMVYAPVETALLERARSLDRDTIDGLVMLIGQASGAFEYFFGQPAPRKYDAELRALLTT